MWPFSFLTYWCPIDCFFILINKNVYSVVARLWAWPWNKKGLCQYIIVQLPSWNNLGIRWSKFQHFSMMMFFFRTTPFPLRERSSVLHSEMTDYWVIIKEHCGNEQGNNERQKKCQKILHIHSFRVSFCHMFCFINWDQAIVFSESGLFIQTRLSKETFFWIVEMIPKGKWKIADETQKKKNDV